MLVNSIFCMALSFSFINAPYKLVHGILEVLRTKCGRSASNRTHNSIWKRKPIFPPLSPPQWFVWLLFFSVLPIRDNNSIREAQSRVYTTKLVQTNTKRLISPADDTHAMRLEMFLECNSRLTIISESVRIIRFRLKVAHKQDELITCVSHKIIGSVACSKWPINGEPNKNSDVCVSFLL